LSHFDKQSNSVVLIKITKNKVFNIGKSSQLYLKLFKKIE